MKNLLSIAAVIVFTAATTTVFGEQKSHSGLGTVQNFDRARNEVSLKHDPIGSLNWPAMTMVFQVKDDGLFDRLRTGTRLAFEFTAEGTRYVVTSVIPLADESSASATPSNQPPHSAMGMMMGSGAMQRMMDNCMAMMKQ